jgi:fimbrial chaperone protein
MRSHLFVAILLLPLLPATGKAQPASLAVTPVVVTLAAGQTATTIQVTNHGAGSTAMQARIYRWTQPSNDDVLTPTDDIIVSPPIFTVPEGGSQTMRLLLRGGPRTGGERTYRLLLDEVPPANGQARRVVLALRLSMPVFLDAATPGHPALQWRAERNPGGQTVLTVSNTGTGYTRISTVGVTLSDGSHPKVVSRTPTAYVLAGAAHQWVVEDSRPAGALQLTVTSLSGKSELTLTP